MGGEEIKKGLEQSTKSGRDTNGEGKRKSKANARGATKGSVITTLFAQPDNNDKKLHEKYILRIVPVVLPLFHPLISASSARFPLLCEFGHVRKDTLFYLQVYITLAQPAAMKAI